MQVGGSAVHTAQAQGFGERLGGDAGGLVAHQLFHGQQQELGLLFYLVPVPGLKAEATAHVGGQLLVVKRVNQLFVHQHVLTARLVLQVFHLLNEFLVGSQKRQFRVPVAAHQRLADENFAGTRQVHPAVVHAAAAVNDDAVQRGALQRVNLSRLLFPMRVQQLLL